MSETADAKVSSTEQNQQNLNSNADAGHDENVIEPPIARKSVLSFSHQQRKSRASDIVSRRGEFRIAWADDPEEKNVQTLVDVIEVKSFKAFNKNMYQDNQGVCCSIM